jgi:hypothetical protein
MISRSLIIDLMAALEEHGPLTTHQLAGKVNRSVGPVFDALKSTPGFKFSHRKNRWTFNVIDVISTKEMKALEDTLSGFSNGSSNIGSIPRHDKPPVLVENATPELMGPRNIVSKLVNLSELDFFIELLDKARTRAIEYNRGQYQADDKAPNLNDVITELPKVIPALQTMMYLIHYILSDPRFGTPEEWAILLTRPIKVKAESKNVGTG